jgi:putative MATE family efflux protein
MMTENKMGVMPIPKLLISMSLPMMISMLVQALYNIVDSIFVAQISENALTAVSLAFPLQNLMIAVASGTAVGINALLSRSLGEKNFEEAKKAAKNGLFLAFLSYIAFALFGIFCTRLYFISQTDVAEIVDYGVEYTSVVLIVSIGLFYSITQERLLQATGKSFYSMISQICGALTNIIFDPILIFGLLGAPKLGVKGAAIATVAGQLVATVVSCVLNLWKNKEISYDFRGFRPNGRIIATIYKVGVPSTIMVAIGSLLTYYYNKILLMFSTTAVSVYGIYFKLNSFIFMPVFGLNNGMIPIIAYNYGARNKKRILETVKLSAIVAMLVMALGTVIFQIVPGALLGLFDASDHMLEIGIPALRIISLSFIFAGYNIVMGSVFQAFGNGVYSLIISLVRQLFVVLPAAYLLAVNFGLHQTWWSYPIAETVAVVMSTLFFIRLYQQKIKHIEKDKCE